MNSYDYYLAVGGGYFGTKKGCEMIHAMYAYDDRAVYVTNSLYQPTQSLKVVGEAFTLNGTCYWRDEASIGVIAADSASKAELSTVQQPLNAEDGAYFVRLSVYNEKDGSLVSKNLYWFSTTDDVNDWDNSTWYNTPCAQFADLTQLRSLPRVSLDTTSLTTVSGDTALTTVTIGNLNNAVAFFVRVRLQWR
eukprot:TRINITY_DN2478_c0_g1_i1.p1 TRINITY_DN2478_c0_g1~~TRINITY_DN2478_c0_g1_i1.p1  ORF type:complete len:192 (+),score=61.00 TRINITY_DN2478_c0_g1_i1:45-620(+)